MSIVKGVLPDFTSPKSPSGLATYILLIAAFVVIWLFVKGLLSSIFLVITIIIAIGIWKIKNIMTKLYLSVILIVAIFIFYLSLW